jgi:hypothetical protein
MPFGHGSAIVGDVPEGAVVCAEAGIDSDCPETRSAAKIGIDRLVILRFPEMPRAISVNRLRLASRQRNNPKLVVGVPPVGARHRLTIRR